MNKWFKISCPECKEENWISNRGGRVIVDTQGIDALKCWSCCQSNWVDKFSEEYHEEGTTPKDYADQGHRAPESKYINDLEEFARDIRDNYDCDEDGHRHNTGCRACDASNIVGRNPYWDDIKPEQKQYPIDPKKRNENEPS